jgi:tetratricopeptide (TPR) repeat protein
MRRLLLNLTLVILFVVGATIAAQDDPTPDPSQLLATVEALATQVAEDAEFAGESAVNAEAATDLAFNLLGIFEAISVAITIVAAGAGLFGIGRLVSAESSLTKARDEVEKEIVDIREQFDSDLEARRGEFEALSHRLTDLVEQQRKDSANATLATALLSFGERQYRATDYEGAVDTYRRALDLDNNNPVTYYRLGYVYISQGDLVSAEDNLKQSLEIDSDFAPARVALGYAYRRMGEKKESGIEREQLFNLAEQAMLAGLKASPKLIDDDGESWWGSLGGLYRRRGQTEQAIYAYEQAMAVTPHSSYPFSNLARLYGDEENIEGMLRMFQRVERLAYAEVQAEVDNYWGYFDLLTAQLANGHPDKAEDTLPFVLETVPSDAAYAFDVLIETLHGVANSLAGYDQVKDIETFIGRIHAHVEKREQASTRGDGLRPEDTAMTEAVSSEEDSSTDDDS